MIEIERRATLFRIGRPQGLWYDVDGRPTGHIHRLTDGKAGSLPMGPDPIFRDQGKRWISVTTTLDELRTWFSEQDVRELLPQGYVVEAIDCARYRRLEFDGFGHEVYAIQDRICSRTVDPRMMYPRLKRGWRG